MAEQTYAWMYKATWKEGTTFAGGTPYTLPGEQWPTDGEGNPMAFLFQADLAGAPDLGLDLPEEGYLQFFHCAEELFGMNLEGVPSQDSCVLVRHLGPEAQDFPLEVPEELLGGDNTPLLEPQKRVYYEGHSELMTVPSWEDYPDTDDEDAPPVPVVNSAEFYLGGLPIFTQEDFREQTGETPVLLLGSDSGGHIMWGNAGAGGFWMPEGALEAGAFKEAFLYWDCS